MAPRASSYVINEDEDGNPLPEIPVNTDIPKPEFASSEDRSVQEGVDSEMQGQNDYFQSLLKDVLDGLHGPETPSLGSLRDQVTAGKLSATDYYLQTGRIWAGSSTSSHDQDRNAELNRPGINQDEASPEFTALKGGSVKAWNPSSSWSQRPFEIPVRSGDIPSSISVGAPRSAISPMPSSIQKGITSPITGTFTSGNVSGFTTPYGTVTSRIAAPGERPTGMALNSNKQYAPMGFVGPQRRRLNG